MNSVLTKESDALLQLLAKDMFNVKLNIDWEDIDLKTVFEEAKNQTVIATAFNAMPSKVSQINPQIYTEWQNLSFVVMQKKLNNIYGNVKLTALLNENNIKHTTIKGYSSVYYYPNTALRQMGDIDFLINESDLEKCNELLLANEFNIIGHGNDLHFEYSKNQIIYEMHTSVTYVPKGKEFVLEPLKNVISNSRTVMSICGEIVIPSELHHCIIMLMHMQRHLTNGGGIGLRHVCDWAMFVNAFSNEEWVNLFENELKKIGLWQFAKVISKTSHLYLQLPSKEWFSVADDALAEDLLYDIFDGGNFGYKNKSRIFQNVFVDQSNKNRNAFIRFFKGVTNKIYRRFPFYERNKWLLPIGYSVYAVCILFEIIFKGKKINFIKIYKGGNRQHEIYSKLRFFEEEK